MYLNGAEIWRDTNMPSGVFSNQTPALTALGGTNETNWLSFSLERSGLVTGWNLLAAEVHQQNLTSSDIGFDFELLGTIVNFGPPPLAAFPLGGSVTLTWPAAASYFRLESTPELKPAAWASVTNQPALTNGSWRIDWVPGGRRFFRLQAP